MTEMAKGASDDSVQLEVLIPQCRRFRRMIKNNPCSSAGSSTYYWWCRRSQLLAPDCLALRQLGPAVAILLFRCIIQG